MRGERAFEDKGRQMIEERKTLAYDDGHGVRRGIDESWLQVGVVLAGLGAVVAPLMLWLLQKLKYAPYRPPEDMSTLLTSSDRAIVTGIQVILLIGWWLCVWVILWALRKRRGGIRER